MDQSDQEDPQVPPDPMVLRVSKVCEVSLAMLVQLDLQVDPDQEDFQECPEKMVIMEMMEHPDPQVLLDPQVTVVFPVCPVSPV